MRMPRDSTRISKPARIDLAAENVELAGYGKEPPFDRQSSIYIHLFIYKSLLNIFYQSSILIWLFIHKSLFNNFIEAADASA